MSTAMHPGRVLRDRMDASCIAIPGAFNALVARAVAQAGFDAVYVSGGATANVAGYPDVGLITLTEMARTIREVARASGLPTLVDADTGYGEVECAVRTIIEYADAGAAGLHVEDQVFPKRCGHLDGKELIAADAMCEKVAAMHAHRPHDDFVICARTDAAGVAGLDEAVDRAVAYAAAGADMIFPEGLRSEDAFAQFAEAFRARADGYLLANMTEFGKTPMIPVHRFAELGYNCVIFPLSVMRLAMGEVVRALGMLREDGDVGRFQDRMQTRAELYELLGYTPGEAWNLSK
jgi:methylisocitrate lyase